MGKRYYSTYEFGAGYEFSVAKYHMTYKWYPGFNDYPLGEEHDYNANPVIIVGEWITGADADVNTI